jgi:hypothetical protein
MIKIKRLMRLGGPNIVVSRIYAKLVIENYCGRFVSSRPDLDFLQNLLSAAVDLAKFFPDMRAGAATRCSRQDTCAASGKTRASVSRKENK